MLIALAVAAGLVTIAIVARALARARGVVKGVAEASPNPDTQTTTLGGRRFVVATDGTVLWDEYVIGALKRAGLIPLPRLARGETHGEYASRLLVELISGRELAALLGGLLLPEGVAAKSWTPELAAETAAFVSALSAPSDKQKVHNLAISILLDFFEHGIASSLTSLDSSSETEIADGDDPAPSDSGSDTASGRFWSQFSRKGIPIDPNALQPGSYATHSSPTSSAREGSSSSSTGTKSR